jgi:hypothetical protein
LATAAASAIHNQKSALQFAEDIFGARTFVYLAHGDRLLRLFKRLIGSYRRVVVPGLAAGQCPAADRRDAGLDLVRGGLRQPGAAALPAEF